MRVASFLFLLLHSLLVSRFFFRISVSSSLSLCLSTSFPFRWYHPVHGVSASFSSLSFVSLLPTRVVGGRSLAMSDVAQHINANHTHTHKQNNNNNKSPKKKRLSCVVQCMASHTGLVFTARAALYTFTPQQGRLLASEMCDLKQCHRDDRFFFLRDGCPLCHTHTHTHTHAGGNRMMLLLMSITPSTRMQYIPLTAEVLCVSCVRVSGTHAFWRRVAAQSMRTHCCPH